MAKSSKHSLIAGSILAALVFLVGCAGPKEKYDRYLQKGKTLLLEDKDPSRALLELHNAVREQPNEADAYYWIAQALLGRNQLREAIASLRKAVDLKPDHSAAQLKLAELMIRTRDEELMRDAEARIQKILTGNPGNEDALFTLAASQAQLGRMEDAEKYLNEALKKSPGHLRSEIALALLKVSQKDLPAAEQILKKAIQQAPNSVNAAMALATIYISMSRLAEAESLLIKATELEADNADAWIALGSLQTKLGKQEAAEQTFKRAAQSPNTKTPLAYVVFLIRQNRRPAAIAELERIVNTNRDNRIARSALVASYMTDNRQAAAEVILEEVLQRNPKDLEALLQRSQIYLRKRRFDDALADLNRVLSLEPTSGQGHYLRSKVFWVKGDDLRRRQDLAEALQFFPDSLPVRIELADALMRANRPKDALQMLNEAPAHQRRTLAFVIAHNWAIIGVGDVTQARKVVDRALAVSKDPQLLLQDATLKIAARDFRGARTSLEQVLQADPEDLRALGLLAQSYVAENQRPAATQRIRQIAQQRPQSVRLQVFWAQWLLEENQKDEARKVLAAVTAVDPGNTDALFLSAGLDFNERRLENARGTLNVLFKTDAKNVNALVLAGQVEEAADNQRDAAEHYQKAIALDSSNVFALNNLAYIMSRDPARVDEGLTFARKAKELAPESPQVLDTLGWLYYRKGFYPQAARELEAALAKAEWPSIQFHLGLTYNRLGNTVKGDRLVATALAKDPKLAGTEALQ